MSDVAFGLVEFRATSPTPFVVRYDYRIQTVRTAPALDATNHKLRSPTR